MCNVRNPRFYCNCISCRFFANFENISQLHSESKCFFRFPFCNDITSAFSSSNTSPVVTIIFFQPYGKRFKKNQSTATTKKLFSEIIYVNTHLISNRREQFRIIIFQSPTLWDFRESCQSEPVSRRPKTTSCGSKILLVYHRHPSIPKGSLRDKLRVTFYMTSPRPSPDRRG
jgi:hypothetical protein